MASRDGIAPSCFNEISISLNAAFTSLSSSFVQVVNTSPSAASGFKVSTTKSSVMSGSRLIKSISPAMSQSILNCVSVLLTAMRSPSFAPYEFSDKLSRRSEILSSLNETTFPDLFVRLKIVSRPVSSRFETLYVANDLIELGNPSCSAKPSSTPLSRPRLVPLRTI